MRKVSFLGKACRQQVPRVCLFLRLWRRAWFWFSHKTVQILFPGNFLLRYLPIRHCQPLCLCSGKLFPLVPAISHSVFSVPDIPGTSNLRFLPSPEAFSAAWCSLSLNKPLNPGLSFVLRSFSFFLQDRSHNNFDLCLRPQMQNFCSYILSQILGFGKKNPKK